MVEEHQDEKTHLPSHPQSGKNNVGVVKLVNWWDITRENLEWWSVHSVIVLVSETNVRHTMSPELPKFTSCFSSLLDQLWVTLARRHPHIWINLLSRHDLGDIGTSHLRQNMFYVTWASGVLTVDDSWCHQGAVLTWSVLPKCKCFFSCFSSSLDYLAGPGHRIWISFLSRHDLNDMGRTRIC